MMRHTQVTSKKIDWAIDGKIIMMTVVKKVGVYVKAALNHGTSS